MAESLTDINLFLSANELKFHQNRLHVRNLYVLDHNDNLISNKSAIKITRSNLIFPEISPKLTFNSEEMLKAMLAAECTLDFKLIKASYLHYIDGGRMLGGRQVIDRSMFVTNLDNGGNIVFHACQSLGISVDELEDIPGYIEYAVNCQTHGRDRFVECVLNGDYISTLIKKASEFKK